MLTKSSSLLNTFKAENLTVARICLPRYKTKVRITLILVKRGYKMKQVPKRRLYVSESEKELRKHLFVIEDIKAEVEEEKGVE